VISATETFLQKLRSDLSPVRSVIYKLASSETNLEPRSGALRLSHRPQDGSEAYAVVLFPGVGLDIIERYENTQRARIRDYRNIPAFYKDILTQLNGAFLFDTALFGIPPSMVHDPALLDRSALQPLDACTANEDWRLEYGPPPTDHHFACGWHSVHDKIGYFLTSTNSVGAYLAGGKKIGDWETMNAFLADVVERPQLSNL
jgi:hypothetical protein